MVSTVTTTVVTVVTSAASFQLVGSLGLAAVLTLITLFATKELAGAGDGVRARSLSHNVNIPIFALLFVFAFIVSTRVLEILFRS